MEYKFSLLFYEMIWDIISAKFILAIYLTFAKMEDQHSRNETKLIDFKGISNRPEIVST